MVRKRNIGVGGGVTGSLIILAIGVIFLLRNLGILYGSIWSILGPSILIAIGIGGLFGHGFCFIRTED